MKKRRYYRIIIPGSLASGETDPASTPSPQQKKEYPMFTKKKMFTLIATLITSAAITMSVISCGSDEDPPGGGENANIKNTANNRTPADNFEAPNMLPISTCDVDEETGARVKAVVMYHDVYCMNTPGGKPNGIILPFYGRFYVFDYSPSKENPRYIKIGNEPDRADLNWVRASDVQLWNHNLGIYFKNEGLREVNGKWVNEWGKEVGDRDRLSRLVFFKDLDDAVKYHNGDRSVKPIGQTERFYEGKVKRSAWMVQKKVIKNVKGKPTEFLKVIVCGNRDAGEPDPEAVKQGSGSNNVSKGDIMNQDFDKLTSEVNTIKIVIVIDSTASMTEEIAAAKEAVKMIARSVSEFDRKPVVRFGLVEYRDYVPGIMFGDRATRVYPLVSTIKEFNRMVDGLSAAKIGSEGLPEAVYDGIKAGIVDIDWGDDLSHKVIIHIGDNSALPPNDRKLKGRNPVTEEEITSLAQERQIVIFSMACPTNADADEVSTRDRQFYQLANDNGGQYFSIQEAEQIIPRIRDIFNRGYNLGTERIKILGSIKAGEKFEQIKKKIGGQELARQIKFFEGAGYDMSRFRKGETVAATAWICVDAAGANIVERQVYILRRELDFMATQINNIRIVLIQKPESTQDLLRILAEIRAGKQDFLYQDEDITWNVHRFALKLPMRQNGSFMNLTPRQILNMNTTDRRKWILRLEDFHASLYNHLRDDTFLPPLETTPGWIPEDDCP